MNDTIRAIQNKDLEAFKINTDISPHTFSFAAKNGTVEMLKHLIDKGANIHAEDSQALREASALGRVPIIDLLLDSGVDIHARSDHAVRIAATNGHISAATLLIDRGADVHANNDEALRRTANYGDLATTKFLIEQGSNIHAENDQALRYAAHNGHDDVIKYLISNGANIHAEYSEALREAADNGHTSTVELLLDHGADVHAENDEALQYASLNGDIPTVKILIKHGADIAKVCNEDSIKTIKKAISAIKAEKDSEEKLEKEAIQLKQFSSSNIPTGRQEIISHAKKAIEYGLKSKAISALSRLNKEDITSFASDQKYSGFILSNWQSILPLIEEIKPNSKDLS